MPNSMPTVYRTPVGWTTRGPLHRHRRAAQCRQVHPVQRPDQQRVLAANYPFATIDPNVGVVAVPDARLARLAALYDDAPVVPATVTFVDIAGIVRGASQGEGLGNKFLAAIRESDAICQVVRVFHDDDVIHVDGRVDPAERHRDGQHRADPGRPADGGEPAAQAGQGSPVQPRAAGAVEAVARPARSSTTDAPSRAAAAGEVDAALLRDLHLLTAKPFIYVFNVDEGALGDDALAAERWRSGRARPSRSCSARRSRPSWPSLDADDAKELLDSYGQDESGLEQLVHVGFATLGLQTFLTAGPRRRGPGPSTSATRRPRRPA